MFRNSMGKRPRHVSARNVGPTGLPFRPTRSDDGSSDPPQPGVPIPAAIRCARYLMAAGAVLQVAAGVTALWTERLTPAGFFAVFSIIATVFWLWTAQAARRAEPGTRSSAIILFAWATVDLLAWRSGAQARPVVTVFALEWLAGLGATALLFGKGSTVFFRPYRADGRVRRRVRAILAAARRRPASGPGQ
jgi:hypothetical protein